MKIRIDLIDIEHIDVSSKCEPIQFVPSNCTIHYTVYNGQAIASGSHTTHEFSTEHTYQDYLAIIQQLFS